jgi:hypothetical protein
MTPVDVRKDGELIEQSVFLDQLQLTPESMVLEVQHQHQGKIAVTPQQDTTIYDEEGAELGSALNLARQALNVHWAVKSIQVLAHNHPEREALERVSLALDINTVGYQLRDDETGRFHPILAAHVEARLSFNQAEIRFRTTDLGGRQFGQGRGIIFDREAVWVATTNPETDETTISWRTTDDKPLFSPPPPPAPPKFHAVRELPPPPDWVDPVGREHPL